MKLEQIHQVISLAETGSFTESARQLYVSQPNLSTSIKQLEYEIGNTIFERTNSGLVLTPFGQEFLGHLYSIKRELSEAEAFCHENPQVTHHRLNVVMAKCAWLNDYFSRTICDYSGELIHFGLMNTESLEKSTHLVQTSQCDLAVVALNNMERKSVLKKWQRDELDYCRLHSSPLYVTVGEHSPLYTHEGPLSVEELRKYPYVGYGNLEELGRSFFLRAFGISPYTQSVISVNSIHALYNVIRGTEAFSISTNLLNHLEQPGIHAIPVSEMPYFIEYGWIKQHRVTLPEPAERFIRYVTEAISDKNN